MNHDKILDSLFYVEDDGKLTTASFTDKKALPTGLIDANVLPGDVLQLFCASSFLYKSVDETAKIVDMLIGLMLKDGDVQKKDILKACVSMQNMLVFAMNCATIGPEKAFDLKRKGAMITNMELVKNGTTAH